MPDNNEDFVQKICQLYPSKNEILAQKMYHAYGETTDFKNFQGTPMPPWEELPEGIRKAWIAAATKARFEVVKEVMAIAIDNIFSRTF